MTNVDAQSLRKGIWAINTCSIMFVFSDTIVKFLGLSFQPNQIVFVRSVIITIVILVIMLVKRHRLRLRRAFSLPMLTRCIFDCCNILTFTAAVVHMGIGELYAIWLTSPLIMTVMAAVFFSEPVGIRRWLAIIVGFGGVLLIVKPNMGSLDQWALLGLASAVTAAARDTITQKIDPEASTFEVTFYSAIVVGVAALLISDTGTWIRPTPQQGSVILAQAGTWFAGTLFLIQAYRLGPISLMASFRYTMLVWGGLAGYFAFGEIPDYLSMIGGALIASSGLYTFHREAVRRRPLASKAIT